jgi:hypothetical protein
MEGLNNPHTATLCIEVLLLYGQRDQPSEMLILVVFIGFYVFFGMARTSQYAVPQC